MPVVTKLKHIGVELKSHAPFTLFGALMGIVFMLIFKGMADFGNTTLFQIFHPLHVVLSAMVTASLFKLKRNTKNFLLVLVVGWVGALGIATLSDSVIPYLGETVLQAPVPIHADLHDQQVHDDVITQEQHADHADESDHAGHDHEHPTAQPEPDEHVHEHGGGLHIGFIEDWYIVNPAAILGVIIAFWLPSTKMPHAFHVLISTWASSAHMLMNIQAELSATLLIGMFIVLFLAVWLPCCVSDIIFPLLFVKSEIPVCSNCHHNHSTKECRT